MSDALTLAYLEQAPAAAAKVLQEVGLEESAAFLETVPARLSAPVVGCMIPAMAARCLERLTAPRGAAILRSLAYPDAASLLRLVRAERRDRILTELPSSTAKRLHRSLEYSINAVGAWIDPDVPLLAPQHTVEDALRYLRDTGNVSHIFLESETNGRFIGAISVNSLLHSDRKAPLAHLPVDPIKPISNRSALATIVFHPAWDEYLALPVVGRRHNVLGSLSRAALRRGVHGRPAETAGVRGSMLAHLVSALLSTFAGIVRVALQAGSSPAVNRQEERFRGQ